MSLVSRSRNSRHPIQLSLRAKRSNLVQIEAHPDEIASSACGLLAMTVGILMLRTSGSGASSWRLSAMSRRSLHLDITQLEPVVAGLRHLDIGAGRPHDHLLVQRDIGELV